GALPISPNGLDDRGYSTARSLAAMSREAMRDPLFARAVRTKFQISPAASPDSPRRIQNRNVLLWLYPGAIGVKTGFTTKAGYCLVATAKVGGARMAAVVLGEPTSEDSFSDAARLLSFAFHSYVRSRVVAAGAALPAARLGGLRV